MSLLFYLVLFSNVAVESVDSYTLVMPYCVVTTNDFGKSSQDTNAPSFCAFSKNSRVRFDVEVLSISKIPITELSRTDISLPIFKYISTPPHVIASQCAHWRGNPFSYKIVWYRSSHFGFIDSTNLFFLLRFQDFICFSLDIAA